MVIQDMCEYGVCKENAALHYSGVKVVLPNQELHIAAGRQYKDGTRQWLVYLCIGSNWITIAKVRGLRTDAEKRVAELTAHDPEKPADICAARCEQTKIICGKLLDGRSSTDGEDKLETLMEELDKQIAEDDEPRHKKALALLKDYIEDPETVDSILTDLCGWTLHSLLVFAGLTRDTEGLLGGEREFS